MSLRRSDEVIRIRTRKKSGMNKNESLEMQVGWIVKYERFVFWYEWLKTQAGAAMRIQL